MVSIYNKWFDDEMFLSLFYAITARQLDMTNENENKVHINLELKIIT